MANCHHFISKKNLVLLLFILFSSPIYATTTLPVTAKQGMVVSEQRLASLVGIDILRAGGNAIDAAIAVGYALAVVNPCCGNIGGGGFMTLHLADGKELFINFREKHHCVQRKLCISKITWLMSPHKVI